MVFLLLLSIFIFCLLHLFCSSSFLSRSLLVLVVVIVVVAHLLLLFPLMLNMSIFFFPVYPLFTAYFLVIFLFSIRFISTFFIVLFFLLTIIINIFFNLIFFFLYLRYPIQKLLVFFLYGLSPCLLLLQLVFSHDFIATFPSCLSSIFLCFGHIFF